MSVESIESEKPLKPPTTPGDHLGSVVGGDFTAPEEPLVAPLPATCRTRRVLIEPAGPATDAGHPALMSPKRTSLSTSTRAKLIKLVTVSLPARTGIPAAEGNGEVNHDSRSHRRPASDLAACQQTCPASQASPDVTGQGVDTGGFLIIIQHFIPHSTSSSAGDMPVLHRIIVGIHRRNGGVELLR